VNKTRYYASIGQLVETALNRVLGDILELDDITEEESRQLAELCRIISALEGLFVENTPQNAAGNTGSFVVAYVPSWLKFSYISVLLVRVIIVVMNRKTDTEQEASMVDIQYLFDDGALVDFTGEELAKLVRALFADTPMRASMISRLTQGHVSRV
jgi:centromere/kinetochore protein ZW10